LVDPAVVGVPEIEPPFVMDKPPGKLDPEATAHVYGAVPPAAVNDPVYGAFTVPCGRDVDVIDNDAVLLTVMDKVAVALLVGFSLSVT
jgi:hypothetical protein